MLLLLIETIANGSFLAVGNQAGLLGGASQAFFAALNIGVAFALAYWGVSCLAHRHGVIKGIGILALLLYVMLATVINLALAHYREAAEVLADDAGREVMRRLVEAPLVMADIQSWILFGIGLLFRCWPLPMAGSSATPIRAMPACRPGWMRPAPPIPAARSP
ncbi:hypothetical protein ACFQ4K_05300 [Tistrella bauzanensis]